MIKKSIKMANKIDTCELFAILLPFKNYNDRTLYIQGSKWLFIRC